MQKQKTIIIASVLSATFALVFAVLFVCCYVFSWGQDAQNLLVLGSPETLEIGQNDIAVVSFEFDGNTLLYQDISQKISLVCSSVTEQAIRLKSVVCQANGDALLVCNQKFVMCNDGYYYFVDKSLQGQEQEAVLAIRLTQNNLANRKYILCVVAESLDYDMAISLWTEFANLQNAET